MKAITHLLKPISTLQKFLFCTAFVLSFPVASLAEDLQNEMLFQQTSEARLKVEHAWEAYHHAALGGTLVSPAIQTELETHLHQSRALLAQAYDAADHGKAQVVEKLTREITKITQKVISESRETKK